MRVCWSAEHILTPHRTKLGCIKLTALIVHFCLYFPLVHTPTILHFSNKNVKFPNFANLIRLRIQHRPHRNYRFRSTTAHTETHGSLLIAVKPKAKRGFLVNSKPLFHTLKCHKNLILSEELLQYENNVILHLMALASLRPLRFIRAPCCY